MSDLPDWLRVDREAVLAPARGSSVQLASELPRPRRPMPRQMRPQAGPTRAQTTYGGQQGDVSRMHGFHADEARDRWLHGRTFADRLRGGATLAAETLGLPSVMAEAEALGRRDWASAGQEAPAAAMTAAGPALGLFGRRAPVAPPRAAPEPVTRLPVNPSRIPTRASDGSVLPAREPQPFRRTEARSDDLRDAAAMRPRESDAGSAWREHLRAQGFDVDTPLYHGTSADFVDFDAARGGQNFGGRDARDAVSLTSEPWNASDYAMGAEQPPGTPNVRPVFARGRFAEWTEPPFSDSIHEQLSGAEQMARAADQARADGFDGLIIRSTARGQPTLEYKIFADADGGFSNIAPRFGSRPVRPDGGSDGNWIDLHHGSNQLRGPWRGSLWATPNEDVATNYAHNFRSGGTPNVRSGQGDIDGAVTIRDERDLYEALGPDAKLVDPMEGLPHLRNVKSDYFWELLDDPQVQEALRRRGVSVVHLPDDAGPGSSGGRGRHASYLFLDEGRWRDAQQPAVNPRPDSTLSGSAGGFPIPQVIKRDFQRLAGGGPSPAPSQRALQGPGGRLTAMSRAGAPEMRAPGSAPSGLLQTPKGASQQSAIDPRVILGGGALGMFPTGAATAALVRQNAEENAVIDRMAALQRENKRRFAELRAQRAQRPYQNPGRLDPNRTITAPFGPNPGFAISPANGRVLPVPADAPRDSKGRFVTQQKARHLAAPGF